MPFRQGDQEEQQSAQLEEQYERMFPKMGRDFVTIEDMEAFIGELLNIILTLAPGVDLGLDNAEAIKIAKEYKKNIEKGRDLAGRYKDLVKIESEEEETEE